MSDALQILPIFIFMLIPLWIPLAASAVGALADMVKAPARAAAAHQAAHRTSTKAAAPAHRAAVAANA